ncbi:MAG: hypothetical protein M3R38_32190 [Actinomycetota bacterium]|nr:hypothetical protein [Actinomycetota bacterium]MDP9480271.1 hypothetical protein [Actinomycetota bacterium]
MKPYSKDLRIRVLAAVDRGMPSEEVARIFSVSCRRSSAGSDALARRQTWRPNPYPAVLA